MDDTMILLAGHEAQEYDSVKAKAERLDAVIDACHCPPDVPLLQWVRTLYDMLAEANELRAKAELLDEVIAECEGVIFRTGIAIPNTATEAAKMLLDTAKGESDG